MLQFQFGKLTFGDVRVGADDANRSTFVVADQCGRGNEPSDSSIISEQTVLRIEARSAVLNVRIELVHYELHVIRMDQSKPIIELRLATLMLVPEKGAKVGICIKL